MTDYELIAYPIVFTETAAFKDTYGGNEGAVLLESYLYKPSTPSDTVMVFSHPVGGGAYLPMVRSLARAGHHVIYANSRYKADQALIMEKVVVDLAEVVRHAKEQLGYAKVVLGGWSGGGSLSLLFQEQARTPTLTATPAGDPPDLTAAGLIPADGLVLLAAHPSRHGVLADSIDPSIRNEDDPDDRDPELDLFGGQVGPPPYDRDWLARYREAQLARLHRITDRVEQQLGDLKAAGRGQEERAFVVHGTMADPAMFDGTIDPNDRELGVSYLGDPWLVNNGPVGLGRFSSLRSWLSQWSPRHAQADGIRCAASLDVPVLSIYNAADNICYPSMAMDVHAAIGHDDKELHRIEGANHYYIGPDQRGPLAEATGIVSRWLGERDLS
ncbi:MAG: alpha/beta hydrolase family protein [Acidimicrobiales bacterium]